MDGKHETKRVAIGCQGGGSHTAFTAGVLKRLLAEKQDDYEVVALSGTSGGAICALLAWYALLLKEADTENAGEKAAELLDSFWRKDIPAHSLDARVLNDSIVWLNRASEATVGVPVSNPYHIPHSRFSPHYWQNELRKMIERNVSFDEINAGLVKPSSPRLFVGAVDALAGEFRVFKSHKPDEDRGDEDNDASDEAYVFNDGPDDRISVEAILASAAIPFLFEAVQIGERAYWDGLYSQNPPIRHLTDLDPDEIWIIQINPEEIGEEPKTTADIWDRRSQLAGNLSLNQELAFVRRMNELFRKHAIEKPKIKVRRIEISVPLDAASKLDRSPELIEKLMNHGEEQAALFLEYVRKLSELTKAWEDKDVEGIMDLFTEEATIRFLLSLDSSAREEVRYTGKQMVRDLVERGLRNNLSIQQSRDHRLVAEETICWLLVTADHLRTPAKGRAEAVIREDRIEALTFYPLNDGAAEGLQALVGL